MDEPTVQNPSLIDKVIRFCLENKLVVALLVILFVGWGWGVAPFDWEWAALPRKPVPVDAIPDIGENQQIVFTKWMGRSPQDVDDQITYPLTTALLGIPGVKTIRSNSMFGFSSIYIIFNENIEFYWSRSHFAGGRSAYTRPGRHGLRTDFLVHARGSRPEWQSRGRLGP
jgi:Cu(I)/Ag(I) efflux system membrane protein CusA/SilA